MNWTNTMSSKGQVYARETVGFISKMEGPVYFEQVGICLCIRLCVSEIDCMCVYVFVFLINCMSVCMCLSQWYTCVCVSLRKVLQRENM